MAENESLLDFRIAEPLRAGDLIRDGEWVYETPDGELMKESAYIVWEVNDLTRILHNQAIYTWPADRYTPRGAFTPNGVLASIALSDEAEVESYTFGYHGNDYGKLALQLEKLEEKGLLKSRPKNKNEFPFDHPLGKDDPRNRLYSLPGEPIGKLEVVQDHLDAYDDARKQRKEARKQGGFLVRLGLTKSK